MYLYNRLIPINTEAWYHRARSSTGFASESTWESETVKAWALDLPRMLGIAGLPLSMPLETRRRLRGKITAEHCDLDSWMQTGVCMCVLANGTLVRYTGFTCCCFKDLRWSTIRLANMDPGNSGVVKCREAKCI